MESNVNMNKTSLSVIPMNISPYLNEIAERLWSGHAAVMVGAGFSRNAKPNESSGPGFPDWSQLGDLFYEKIHGVKPDNQKYLNSLKLADEVQAALGRPVLDQMLRDVIPDNEYSPSPLHVKLLELPWTDVFTTNYDTLLERACNSVNERKYDVVVNKGDLAYSEKPRIIKLHGSFPSERPFIITEEDYRCYPNDFAPFVNTVQQALLENTLCLIGFSGDDPNFLQWIGWIRDNLGKQNSPKIYIIGLFSMSDAQKQLLLQRNIILVDMAGYPNVDRDHRKGLEKFIEYLLSRKSQSKNNGLLWPTNQKITHPNHNTDKTAQVKKLLPVWKQQRLSYPGWVVLPEDRRSSLWTSTNAFSDFVSAKDNLSNSLDIEWAYELNWRIERCLLPLSNNQAEFIESILNKYSPFLEATSSLDALPLTQEDMKERGISHKDIRSMYLHMLLSMIRFYREEGLVEKWQSTDNKILKIIHHLSSEQIACLYYERALYALFSLDLPELIKQLADWPVNESLSFWEAKRAGLLAEIGQAKDAEKILEQSLKYIRSKSNLKPITTDFTLVSQEAFVMQLLHHVKMSNAFLQGKLEENKEFQQGLTERWSILEQYKCNPWGELKLFSRSLDRPPIEKRNVTENREFDIGRTTITHHLNGWDNEALIGYNFLRFCEDVGISFRISGGTFQKETAKGALSRISKYSPYWAMATVMRIADPKIVDTIFDRKSLSEMDIASVDGLVDRYLQSLEKNFGDIQSGNRFRRNFGVSLAIVVPEILSRLCCKCSQTSKEKLVDFLLEVYKSDYRINYGSIKNLTTRLLNSFSLREQFNLIPKLLLFPVLEYNNQITQDEFINPFRFLDLDKELTTNWSKPTLPSGRIDVLLKKIVSGNENTRKWAIDTLDRLHDLRLLNDEQSNKLIQAIWSKQDVNGFPSQTNFYKFVFINKYPSENVDSIALFKTYIQSEPFPIPLCQCR